MLVVLTLAAVVAIGALMIRRGSDPDRPPAPRAAEPAAFPLLPSPGRTGSATCVDPSARQEWRVSWRAIPTAVPANGNLAARLGDRAAAVTLVPTGFAVRPVGPAAGAWTSTDDQRWLVRWSPTLAETVVATPTEEWVRTGPLPVLADLPMTVRQDPRFVTPDGACTVYLAPFLAGTAGTGGTGGSAGNQGTERTERSGPEVAVVGDSLVAQLDAAEDGTATGSGWLLNRLAKAGDRVEIAGQGGRRWTIRPDVDPGLARADATMQDELRGLRGARSVVVALGTNDAGWVALAPNQEQYELRLAWVQLHLGPMLDELRDNGHCTVLVTMAQRNKTYVSTAPGRFDAAATRINDYLRQRADADPNDRLKLWDWGARADGHGTGDPVPWFGPDTIHLNQAGHGPYADDLASAAALC